jgi:hypothetical protein
MAEMHILLMNSIPSSLSILTEARKVEEIKPLNVGDLRRKHLCDCISPSGSSTGSDQGMIVL